MSAATRILRVCAVAGILSTPVIGAQMPAELAADIPPQPLADALAAYARQTHLQVVYVSGLVRGQTSDGASAGLPREAALIRLLDGTGLQYRFLNARTVRVLVAPVAPANKRPVDRRSLADLRLEEIVISATKRDEVLSSVPISASVLSAEQMDAAGVKSIDEITALTPGVEYDFSSQFGPGTLTNLAVRGINSNTQSPTTAIYMDDVPIVARHIDGGFAHPYPIVFDLARVEVLRGPQGTLFGTGAEGGAIRFVTSQPSTTVFDGMGRFETSTTEHGAISFEAGLAAGGPIVDGKLGVRVSAWYQREGGYVDRVDPFTLATVDANANRTSSRSLRIALAFTPTDALRITPAFTYQSLSIHDSPSFYTYLSDPGAGILRNGKLLPQPATDRFSFGSIKVEADFGVATLTSATSYFDRTSAATVDQTNQAGVAYFGGFGNPLGPAYPSSYLDAVATVLGSRDFQFSQELRATSLESTGPITWVLGIFYAHSREDLTHDTYVVTDPLNPGIYNLDYKVDTDLAAFADASLKLSHRWRVSVGARFGGTKTDVTDYAAGFANSGAVPFFRNIVDAQPVLTPRFAVSYQPDEDNFLYATVARGLRAGGANNPQCDAPQTYAPDFVWNYEVGAKDSLFDHRLRLATSMFYARWTGVQQRRTNSCFNDYITNSGAAVSTGFDLTADVMLNDRAYLGLAVGFDDAHYTTTVRAGQDVVVAEGTAVGGLPAVPAPWTLMVAGEYRLPIRNGAVGYARAEEIIHTHNPGPFLESDTRSSSFNTTQFADPATKRLNLYLGMTRGGLDLRLSVINVLNSQPLLQHDSDASGSSLQYAYTFRPRTLAFTVTRKF